MTATEREVAAQEIVAESSPGLVKTITRAQATQIVIVLFGLFILFALINPEAFVSAVSYTQLTLPTKRIV